MESHLILKGMGVPMGDMKGVLDSEAEPNVAARDMSDPLPLGCCCLPPPPLPEIVMTET